MRLALLFSVVLFGVGGATPALADRASLSATATFNSHTPGQIHADFAGNRVIQGSVFMGQISGSPISGSFRMVVDLTFSDGSRRGDIEGSFAAFDSAGNTLYGEITRGDVTDNGTSLSIDGRFSIQGGTGLFDDSRGRGRFEGSLPSVFGTTPSPAVYPYGSGLYSNGIQYPSVASVATLSLSGNLRLDDDDGWRAASGRQLQQLRTLLQLVDREGYRAVVTYDDNVLRVLRIERRGSSDNYFLRSGSHDDDDDDDRGRNRNRNRGRSWR